MSSPRDPGVFDDAAEAQWILRGASNDRLVVQQALARAARSSHQKPQLPQQPQQPQQQQNQSSSSSPPLSQSRPPSHRPAPSPPPPPPPPSVASSPTPPSPKGNPVIPKQPPTSLPLPHATVSPEVSARLQPRRRPPRHTPPPSSSRKHHHHPHHPHYRRSYPSRRPSPSIIAPSPPPSPPPAKHTFYDAEADHLWRLPPSSRRSQPTSPQQHGQQRHSNLPSPSQNSPATSAHKTSTPTNAPGNDAHPGPRAACPFALAGTTNTSGLPRISPPHISLSPPSLTALRQPPQSSQLSSKPTEAAAATTSSAVPPSAVPSPPSFNANMPTFSEFHPDGPPSGGPVSHATTAGGAHPLRPRDRSAKRLASKGARWRGLLARKDLVDGTADPLLSDGTNAGSSSSNGGHPGLGWGIYSNAGGGGGWGIGAESGGGDSSPRSSFDIEEAISFYSVQFSDEPPSTSVRGWRSNHSLSYRPRPNGRPRHIRAIGRQCCMNDLSDLVDAANEPYVSYDRQIFDPVSKHWTYVEAAPPSSSPWELRTVGSPVTCSVSGTDDAGSTTGVPGGGGRPVSVAVALSAVALARRRDGGLGAAKGELSPCGETGENTAEPEVVSEDEEICNDNPITENLSRGLSATNGKDEVEHVLSPLTLEQATSGKQNTASTFGSILSAPSAPSSPQQHSGFPAASPPSPPTLPDAPGEQFSSADEASLHQASTTPLPTPPPPAPTLPDSPGRSGSSAGLRSSGEESTESGWPADELHANMAKFEAAAISWIGSPSSTSPLSPQTPVSRESTDVTKRRKSEPVVAKDFDEQRRAFLAAREQWLGYSRQSVYGPANLEAVVYASEQDDAKQGILRRASIY